MILELLDHICPLPPYNIMPAPIIRAKSFTSLKTYLRQDINDRIFNISPKNEKSNKYMMMEIYLQWITLIKWLGPISVLKTILRNTERSVLCTSTFYLCTSTYIIPFRPYAVNHLHGHAGLVARAAWQGRGGGGKEAVAPTFFHIEYLRRPNIERLLCAKEIAGSKSSALEEFFFLILCIW